MRRASSASTRPAATGAANETLTRAPPAAVSTASDVSRGHAGDGTRVGGWLASSSSTQRDPLGPRQALGGRDGAAQRDPVPDHDDHRVDLLEDGADLVGHRGRSATGGRPGR